MSIGPVLSIPNIMTLFRIVIIPVFVTTLIYQNYGWAVALFVVAGLTDMLDGLIARRTNQYTKLGAFLDPLADKALLLTSFILFSVYGWIPTWLTVVVISRDLIIMIGWLLLYLTANVTKVAPTIIGKAAIASEIILVAYILADINFPPLPDVPEVVFWLIAVLAIVSGLQYIIRGLSGNEK